MKNVSKAKLETLSMPSVSIADQHVFAAQVAQIDAQRARVERALAADDELFASLQARAFTGEL